MISHNTAKQMAEMGFPQPEPKFGQMWYDDKGRICAFMRLAGNVGNWKLAGTNGNTFQESPKWYIYAPTVADIMRELSHEYSFRFYFKMSEVRYIVTGRIIQRYLDEIPEEAAAKAWIEKHS